MGRRRNASSNTGRQEGGMRSLQIAVVAIGILSTARAGPGTDGPVLTVRAIADCVPAGSAVIGYASEIAQEILREAGVSTRWSSCRVEASSGAPGNGCPSGPDRPDLTIRIVSEPSPGQA